MTTSHQVASVRRQLETGNWETPVAVGGSHLPSRDEVEARIDAFVAAADHADAGALKDDLQAALRAIYGEESAASGLGFPAMEAVVIADGSRPVFWLQDDALVKLGEPNGDFVDLLEDNHTVIEAAALSIGRVETDDAAVPDGLDKAYVGTAFLVADDMAITNRHVIEEMVTEPTSAGGPFELRATYWLNFAAQYGAAAPRRFKVERVLYAGDQPIGEGGDIGKLDLAILQIGAPETIGVVRPAPLRLTGRRLLLGEKVVTVGYPGKPRIWYSPGAPPHAYETKDVLVRLFDSRFGFKRCASGEIDAVTGFESDVRGWTVKHDATTLGGNSGSPLLTLGAGGARVSALHFGGISRQANYAHAIEKLDQLLATHGLNLEA